jgi:hypothetical protein
MSLISAPEASANTAAASTAPPTHRATADLQWGIGISTVDEEEIRCAKRS